MLNTKETVAEFLARKGATVCAPAGENTPRTPVRKFKGKGKAETAPAPARKPVFFDVGDYVDVIAGTARNYAKGRDAAELTNAAFLRCVEQVRAGKFYGGDAGKWCSTVTANVCRNDAKKASNGANHAELNSSGESRTDSGDAVSGVILPAGVEELRAVRAVEVGRLEAFIAAQPADVATFIRARIETGSNNEACAAVGWTAVRGSRTWKEFQADARRAVGMAELAPMT